jgi:hypothetical protein
MVCESSRNTQDFVLVERFRNFVNKNFLKFISSDFSLCFIGSRQIYCGKIPVESPFDICYCGHRLMARKEPYIEPLAAVLDKSLKRLELSARLDEYGVWPVWNDVVGKPIARNAQPEKIRNGTLFVKVTNPVWMQQLQFMKEMIAEKLNQRLRGEVVKNIFFVVGRIDSDIELNESKSPPAQETQLENSRIDVDEAFLESVKDPEIRQVFKRLVKRYSRRKRKE